MTARCGRGWWAWAMPDESGRLRASYWTTCMCPGWQRAWDVDVPLGRAERWSDRRVACPSCRGGKDGGR